MVRGAGAWTNKHMYKSQEKLGSVEVVGRTCYYHVLVACLISDIHSLDAAIRIVLYTKYIL